ncbi:hypothetical protein BS17DRAFT_174895 [Gyrodon lividus]|nr:hypothetical protein BS17DRAFT_174895 [Gyrodon lividus]
MPLSLHLPDVVRELRERQEKYLDQDLWLPSTSTAVPNSKDSSPVIPATRQCTTLYTGENITPHPELQQELSNAISELISNRSQSQSQLQPPEQQDIRHRSSQVKTSETHPIKSVALVHQLHHLFISFPLSSVSVIIPPESLVAISSHLAPCNKPSPVLFDIPFPYSLDYITGYAQLLPSLTNSPIIPLRSTSVPPLLPPIPLRKRYISNAPPSSVSDALHAALNTRISLPPLPVPSHGALSLKRNLMTRTVSEEDRPEVDVANIIPKLFTSRNPMFAPTRASSQPPESLFPSVLDLPRTNFPRPTSHHT